MHADIPSQCVNVKHLHVSYVRRLLVSITSQSVSTHVIKLSKVYIVICARKARKVVAFPDQLSKYQAYSRWQKKEKVFSPHQPTYYGTMAYAHKGQLILRLLTS